MKTNDLIDQLSIDGAVRTLSPPLYYAVRLSLVLIVYGMIAQIFLGIRPDLAEQLRRPAFAIEFLLLIGLTLTSLIAAILSMYPDNYQRAGWLKWPYIIFAALSVFLIAQLFMPVDPRMTVKMMKGHAMGGANCTLCIASVAFLPSALIFALIRKGASVSPARAGSYAVLAATGVGCLTLRIAEMNDSIAHILQWHYLPTFVFAILGAWFGKYLLRF